jgi:CheY-like chemotaxis protein
MQPTCILIVDDERLTRISLADYLEEMGYQTAVAGDGESAVGLAAKRSFDVCIIDIRLPGMDGVETILRLKQLMPDAEFIIYTGSPQFVLSSSLRDIGMLERDVVRKPVLDMEVFATLILQKGASR